ncbi:anaerobic glycerol-3-phosphate dehydrogenase subunit A [Aeromonas caviae]|uniref:anaerobic glycerol-3-phosphate dehydrogenase subunit A n=1 Tax=Aeromonas caviae TaxID=648 RepID=UPI000FEBD388|nr:anaerobic glycerol-3-phosphate dehydrogenase subunit A [Aeromonas caviae]MEA9441729.1 anaerobic glycerol-3-phosphate dehydrogenase subunit A [Aeromonas caviae]RWT78816.1 anaerobic glycerol-3-phosphate dehydrogenase subunit A [Aeromonas caviae]
MKRITTQVVIIGGGATGAGIMRDCALRGIDCILLERDDIAAGTTGRNHGLLHSGARYAVTDQESARECIQENRILKRIASHCVEDTGGLFITLPEDDIHFQNTFMDACALAGIDARQLDPAEALRLEPNVNPALIGAIQVPDGTVDPFRLAAANVLDAKEHGARIFTHSKVLGLLRNQDRVHGVKAINTRTGEAFEVECQEVINAAGIWGQQICEYADLGIRMFPAKGSLLIMDYRLNQLVLNRCRKPADADILVPGDTISLIGTTSSRIDYHKIDQLTVEPEEVEVLLREGIKLAPIMARTRLLRAYAGVRPLVAVDGDESGRNISRGIVLLDHSDRDGLQGFNTITGGKLMTYRLMAEWATDLLAKKLGNSKPCRTAELSLPGSRDPEKVSAPGLSVPAEGSAQYRHGERVIAFFRDNPKANALICECEMVTAGEIEYALRELDVDNLVDLRRRTRLGMGPCQGELCAYRAAGLMQEYGKADGRQACVMLRQFLEERYKGTRPVLWGDALREAEFTYWIYEGLFGLGEWTTPHLVSEPPFPLDASTANSTKERSHEI